MKIIVEDGYVKVWRIRDGEIICAAFDKGDKQLVGLEFTDPKYQRSNRTRQAAMRALQEAGYR